MDNNYSEIDPSGMATLQKSLMDELDEMDAETYAYFLAYGTPPQIPNNKSQTSTTDVED